MTRTIFNFPSQNVRETEIPFRLSNVRFAFRISKILQCVIMYLWLNISEMYSGSVGMMDWAASTTLRFLAVLDRAVATLSNDTFG